MTALDASRPSKLQREVATRIVQHIRDHDLQPGDPLTELGLADALRVSRTPVRAALDYLAGLGVVGPGARRGFQVRAAAPELPDVEAEAGPAEEDGLYIRIAEDYVAERLPDEVTEADLMRRYDASRGLVVRVLQRMARELVIERNRGHGWTFAPLLRSARGHDESYRFRLVIEPAAILEPSFQLDRAWAGRSRRAHQEILATPPERLSPIRFFEVNADFHEGVAASSGNHFFLQSVQLQNRLRRFLGYSWTYGHDRIVASCDEHLAILDALEGGDRDWAATLMRRHLELAARLKPEGEGGGGTIPGETP
jgi:DNA-binding GntR family transcriptional regulator